MPPLTMQEEGLTTWTSRPSYCPMLGDPLAAPTGAWKGSIGLDTQSTQTPGRGVWVGRVSAHVPVGRATCTLLWRQLWGNAQPC